MKNRLIFNLFLYREFKDHSIHPDWKLSSDHTPFTITIPIAEEYTNTSQQSIVKDSNKEMSFIKDLTSLFRSISTSIISDIASLD